MTSGVPYITLNDGNKIYQFGLGTWNSPPGQVLNAVYCAIKTGYRHIDCAFVYGNEDEVGKAIKKAIDEKLVKREDLFITSKCWLTYLRPDRVKLCLEKTLKNLQLDYLDLYLIHWPFAFRQNDEICLPETNGKLDLDESVDFCDTWKIFEELKGENLVKSIGVSNFNIEQIERILKICKIKPVINQVECHPYLSQEKLIDFCKKHSIEITSYCPLGSTPPKDVKQTVKLLDDPVVLELAKKYNKSPVQILIRYHIDKNLIVIPKSVTEERIIQNIQVFDFKLDDQDVQRLLALNKPHRFCSFQGRGVETHKEYPFKDEKFSF